MLVSSVTEGSTLHRLQCTQNTHPSLGDAIAVFDECYKRCSDNNVIDLDRGRK